jgi:hypothetical protein
MDAIAEGDLLRAVRLKVASEKLATSGGTGLANLFHRLEETYSGVEALDPVELQTAIDAGLAGSVDQAVAYALSAVPVATQG